MSLHNKILQNKIFTMMLIFLSIICSYFLISGILMEMTISHHIKWLISIFITLIIIVANYNYPDVPLVKKIAFIILIFIIIPFGWLSSASNAGYTVGYIFITLMSVHYFYTGKERIFFITSIIIIATSLMTYQIINPDHFRLYSKSQLIINTVIQVPFMLFIGVFMLTIFTDNLRNSNRILENLSTHDDMTGIYNRRYIYRLLKKVVQDSTTLKPTLIGLVDIDFFKVVNDTYGHDQGDQVIKQVANHIREIIGKHGVVGRYGGDEFIIIFEDCNSHPCVNLVNQLCQLEAINKHFSLIHNISLSGGFALFDGTQSIDESLALVDKRLYRAKLNGRNQVIIS